MNQHDNIILKTGINLCVVNKMLRTGRFLLPATKKNPSFMCSFLLRIPLFSILLSRKWKFERSVGKSIKMVLAIPVFGYDIENRNIFISRDFHHWYFKSIPHLQGITFQEINSPTIIQQAIAENIKKPDLFKFSSEPIFSTLYQKRFLAFNSELLPIVMKYIFSARSKNSANKNIIDNFKYKSQNHQVNLIYPKTITLSSYVFQMNNLNYRKGKSIFEKHRIIPVKSIQNFVVKQIYHGISRRFKSSVVHDHSISDLVSSVTDFSRFVSKNTLFNLYSMPKERSDSGISPLPQFTSNSLSRTSVDNWRESVFLSNKIILSERSNQTSTVPHRYQWFRSYALVVNSGLCKSVQIRNVVFGRTSPEFIHAHSTKQVLSLHPRSHFSHINYGTTDSFPPKVQYKNSLMQHRFSIFLANAFHRSIVKSDSVKVTDPMIHTHKNYIPFSIRSKSVFSGNFFSIGEKELHYTQMPHDSKSVEKTFGAPVASGSAAYATQDSGSIGVRKPLGIADFPAGITSHAQLHEIADKVVRIMEDKFQTEAKRKGLL